MCQPMASSNKEILFLPQSCSSFINFLSLFSTTTLVLIPVDSGYFKILEMRALPWNVKDVGQPSSN